MDQTAVGNLSGTEGQSSTVGEAGTNNQMEQKDIRSLTSFFVWSVFFGSFGVHNFYVGNIGKGILAILFCWTGIPVILGYVTCLLVSKMSIGDINIKYNRVILLDCDKGGRKAFFIVSAIFIVIIVISILLIIATWILMAQAVAHNRYTW